MGQLNFEMPPTCVGRIARIKLPSIDCPIYGNVVDFLPDKPMSPRRIRIQCGLPARQGDVVSTNEYEFMWWQDEEETP